MLRMKQLFKLLKGNWHIFILIVLLTIFGRMSYTYVPLFSQLLMQKLETYLGSASVGNKVNLPMFIINFVDQYSNILSAVIVIIVLLLIWQFIRYIALYLESIVKGTLNENISKNVRLNSYNHIQNLSYEYHNNVDSGDLIQRVTTDIDTTTNFMAYRLMDGIGLFATLIFGSYQMYFINKTIMLVSIIIIPITALASIIYFMKIEKLFKNVEEKESELMVIIQENVSASKVVKAFGNEGYEVKKLEEKNTNYKNAEIKANKVVAIYWGAMDFLMVMQFAAVIVIGIIYSKNDLMDVATLSAALMMAGLLIWPVRGLGRIINDFGKSLVAAGRLKEIFDQVSEYEIDGSLEPEITGNIEFRNVNFKFNNTEKYLLQNVSFTMNEGETVAVIGKTGSGKSTLINILLKMYDYEGSIVIDGVELKDIKKSHLRSNIGTVLQDPFLYSKTVLENIAIANPNATKEEVIEASKIAALEKDINTFQNGYDTIVGEQGTTLSGGQKQRVAIARILVAKKPIIIFDDALSALDNKTDLEIRKALKVSNRTHTSIIITHRMTTAKEADKIIVVNNGTIENIGTHDSLSKVPGLYRNLWEIQGSLEEEFLSMLKDGQQDEPKL